MQIKKLLLPILATVMLICGCQQNNAVSGQDQLVTASENKTTYTACLLYTSVKEDEVVF